MERRQFTREFKLEAGLHHGGVHAHSAPRRQPVDLSQLHKPLVNLLDHFGPHRHAPTSHRLCIRHLAGADAGEVAVHQIGAHLALEHFVVRLTSTDAPSAANYLNERRKTPRFDRIKIRPVGNALGLMERMCEQNTDLHRPLARASSNLQRPGIFKMDDVRG